VLLAKQAANPHKSPKKQKQKQTETKQTTAAVATTRKKTMTGGPRQVELTVAIDKAEEIAVFLRENCHLSLIVLEGVAATTFKFLCSSVRLTKILQQLEKIGCGVTYGTIVVLPVSILKPSLQTPGSRSFGVRERLPIEEVYDKVYATAQLGFNQTLFFFSAASIAALGLIFDSVTTVVSSMLLSPLMDPFVAFVFGSVLRDKKLCLMGLRTFLLGGFAALIIGFVFGLVFSPWANALDWPTTEMENRGSYRGVIAGALVAIPSGLAVGLCVTSGGVNPFVGVAIAASILPPIVNAGILWARASLGGLIETHPSAKKYATMGAYSLGLFGSNVVLIFIAAFFIFKLKSVVHFHGRSPFYEDLPHIITTPQSQRPWNLEKPEPSPTTSIDNADSEVSDESVDVGEDEVPEGFLPVIHAQDLRTSPSPYVQAPPPL